MQTKLEKLAAKIPTASHADLASIGRRSVHILKTAVDRGWGVERLNHAWTFRHPFDGNNRITVNAAGLGYITTDELKV